MSKKPLDSTVLTVNSYHFKVSKKDITTKAFVLIIVHFNYFKQVIFGWEGWEIIFKIIPFLAPQRTLWTTSGAGGKGGEGGWGGRCRISA